MVGYDPADTQDMMDDENRFSHPERLSSLFDSYPYGMSRKEYSHQLLAEHMHEVRAEEAWDERVDLLDGLADKNGLTMDEAEELIKVKWDFDGD